MEIATADLIQLIILIILAITGIVAIWEIHSTKEIHRETLEWNKKNRTYNTLAEFRQLKPHLSREEFKDILKKPSTKIPIERILSAIDKNSKIRSEIIEYLNHHEGIANGISNNLLDENLVKSTRSSSFIQTFNEYQEYILHRRKLSSPTAWEEFEKLVTKWKTKL